MPFGTRFTAVFAKNHILWMFYACILAFILAILLRNLLNHPKVRDYFRGQPIEKDNTTRQIPAPKTALLFQAGTKTLARSNVRSDEPLGAIDTRDDASLDRGLNELIAHVLNELTPGIDQLSETAIEPADEDEDCEHFWQQIPIRDIKKYKEETKNGIASSIAREFATHQEEDIKERSKNALNESDTNSSRPKSPTSSDEESSYDNAASTIGSSKSISTARTSDSSDDIREAELWCEDWRDLRALPNLNFHKILARHVGGAIDSAETDYELVKECHGSYNYVRIYSILTGPSAGKYVVRIPACGTAGFWQEHHAKMPRSEFGTLKLIHERTKCPVPKVIAYDDTLTNDLGAPFILMKADKPSKSRFEKRIRFFQSLACGMAELRNLEFDKIGVLDFDNVDIDRKPSIAPIGTGSEQHAFDSSQAFFITGLMSESPSYSRPGGRVNVQYHLLDTLYRSEPFAKSLKSGDEKETFILRHADLNWQNSLCDPETGEVTGIIDWERAPTVPRCIGYASLPMFLTEDWIPGYDPHDAPHIPWNLNGIARSTLKL